MSANCIEDTHAFGVGVRIYGNTHETSKSFSYFPLHYLLYTGALVSECPFVNYTSSNKIRRKQQREQAAIACTPRCASSVRLWVYSARVRIFLNMRGMVHDLRCSTIGNTGVRLHM